MPLDYARFGGAVPTVHDYDSTRHAAALSSGRPLKGSICSRPDPNLSTAVFEEEGIKEPAVQKDLYERLAKSLREYPVPEANGIQGALDSLVHPNARNVKPANLMDTSIMEEIRKSGFIDKLYGRAPKN